MSAAEAARREAQRILAEPRFHASKIPRPLHGVLQSLGELLAFLPHNLDRLVNLLGEFVPGGSGVVWGILAASLLALTALLGTRMTRRLLSDPRAPVSHAGQAPPPSAAEIERAAAAAEREGRFAEAVRLRFQGGLLGLGEREAIEYRPSISNVEVSHALRSERFDRLARRFEEIAYGGSPAGNEDAEAAREEWGRLLRAGAPR
ncbi:MAG TPA: DUF4129 domain-containing protein [Solirubrobacteraceae bacterium]|nr:DUF4129 domain-containing protein [Solirubrobacteraceae bacterium]